MFAILHHLFVRMHMVPKIIFYQNNNFSLDIAKGQPQFNYISASILQNLARKIYFGKWGKHVPTFPASR